MEEMTIGEDTKWFEGDVIVIGIRDLYPTPANIQRVYEEDCRRLVAEESGNGNHGIYHGG